jgi:hypothetical protein
MPGVHSQYGGMPGAHGQHGGMPGVPDQFGAFGRQFTQSAVEHFGYLPSGMISNPPSSEPPSSKPSVKRMRRKSQKNSSTPLEIFFPAADIRSPAEKMTEEFQILIRFLVWEFGWPDFNEATCQQVITDAQAAYSRKYGEPAPSKHIFNTD